MNDLETLRDAWGQPDPPSPAACSAARAGLLELAAAGGDAQVPGRVRRFRMPRMGIGLAVAGVTAAAIVAGTTFVVGSGAKAPAAARGGGAAASQLSARQILLAAATTAAARPAGSGTYWYVRTFGSEQGIHYSEERWMRPDGEAWVLGVKSGGKLLKYSDQFPDGGTPFWLAGNPWAFSALEGVPMTATHASVPYSWRATQVTFRQLQHLPTSPAELKAWLVAFNRNYDNLDGTPDPQHVAVFDSLTILIAELPAPPRVRAAAFRVIASLPNVKSLGAVNGGQGLLISLSRHLHATLVVDPVTSQVSYTLTASGTAQSPSSVSEIGWWTNHLPKA
jgi:hypothetical protein